MNLKSLSFLRLEVIIMTLEEERQRREAALIKMEGLVALLHTFVHGTEHEVVVTDNGPIKTMAAIANDLRNHETETEQFLTQITTAMDDLAPAT